MKKIALLLLCFCLPYLADAQVAPDGPDISYGSLGSEKLDYWIGPSPNSPIMILVHGGAWKGGGKNFTKWEDAANFFYNEGYAVVNINYILSNHPAYTGFPMQPQNLACAVSWTKSNYQLLNGDTSRIVLFGNSAGGHLVSLHGLHQPNAYAQNCNSLTSLDVLGVVSLSGVYDFDLLPPTNLSSLQATQEMVVDSLNFWKQAQPIENINNSTDTKFLILHGVADGTVGTNQPFSFHDSLLANGYCSELTIFQGRGHNLVALDQPTDAVTLRVQSYLDSLFDGLKCFPTAQNDYISEHQFQIQHNPSMSQVVIENSSSHSISGLAIFGMDGRKLEHTKSVGATVDISDLPAGVYILQFQLDHHLIISKKISKL